MDSLNKSEIIQILDLEQAFLEGLCESDIYNHLRVQNDAIGQTLRRIAKRFGLDEDLYGTTYSDNI